MFVYHPEAAYVSAYSRKRLIGKHLRPNLTAPLLRDDGKIGYKSNLLHNRER